MDWQIGARMEEESAANGGEAARLTSSYRKNDWGGRATYCCPVLSPSPPPLHTAQLLLNYMKAGKEQGIGSEHSSHFRVSSKISDNPSPPRRSPILMHS